MKDSFFKAIADANRRKILYLLKKHTVLNAGEIAGHFEITKASLSDHLKILRNADLICAERRGQFINYRLNTSVFEEIVAWMINIIDEDKENK